MKIGKVWLPVYTDGYKSYPEMTFFRTASSADAYSSKKNGGYMRPSQSKNVIFVSEAAFYLLDSVHAYTFAEDEIERKEEALAKLTEEDKKVLGLTK